MVHALSSKIHAISSVCRLTAVSVGGREAIIETLKQLLKGVSCADACLGTGREAWGEEGLQEARWLLILRFRGVVHCPT